MADKKETVPNIDWGRDDGAIRNLSFSQVHQRPGTLLLSVETIEGRQFDFRISHNAVIGLRNLCEETRLKLGF